MTRGPAIALASLHWGFSQQGGKPLFSELMCTRVPDTVSPRLYQVALLSQPLGTTYLYVLSDTGAMEIALRDPLISKIKFDVDPGQPASESFSLVPAEILWSYGVSGGRPVTFGWSVTQNRPIAVFTQ